MPIRLPDLKGFPYRFGQYTGITPYLSELTGELGSESQRLHRSRISLQLVREDVLKYTNDAPSLADDPLYQLAVTKVADAFRLSKPQPLLHFNDVVKEPLDIWSSSPGLPYRLSGFRTKGEVRDNPHLLNNIRWKWHRVKCGERVTFPDCCAYVRSHLAPEGEEKCRAVWGYPMAMTLGEAIFALPLIRAYSKHPGVYPIAYGFETANGGTRRVCRRFAGRRGLLGMDYRSFDKTVPAWLIRSAFYILEQNLDFLNYQNYGTTNVEGVLRQWNLIKNYFIRTPIRLANGERYLKTSGVASGSYFTQLIDSVVNAILIVYTCLKVLGKLPEDYIVFGDDSIVAAPGLSLSAFQSVLKAFGMEINAKKSSASDSIADLEFLGYELKNAVPSKPYSKWIHALLMPEHPDTCWDQVCSRALGLYYANLGVDGKFHAICHRIMQTSDGCDLMLSRDLSKMLRMAGFPVNSLNYRDLPDALTLYTTYIMKEPP